MRIDPKGAIGGFPTLLVRQTLRELRGRLPWGLAELEAAVQIMPGKGRPMVKALQREGLIEAASRGAWEVTQAGERLAAATAAKPITRATAERALAEFLERVARVNDDPYFLARVTRVVLFGSMLRPEVERLSDVDLAVELTAKEADRDRLRAQNEQRAEELDFLGNRFRTFVERQFCWHLETFSFLKGRSRAISLADYTLEKSLVLTVPHRLLIGMPEETPPQPAATAMPSSRSRRPRGMPF